VKIELLGVPTDEDTEVGEREWEERYRVG